MPSEYAANVVIMREVQRLLDNHFSGNILLHATQGRIGKLQTTETRSAEELDPNLHLTPDERRAIR